ncbi:MAG: hypothetical protein U9R16_02855 [Campylobacterota bacterium]|nr:hypothetical protein [Campylobacterota bacterium]
MDREIFIKKLETFQRSAAPIDVKTKAINRLKNEFLNSKQNEKFDQIRYDILISSSELKASELDY